MTRLTKFGVAASLLAAVSFCPGISRADSYDTDDSDHPVKYFVYPIHAYGKGIEYFVTRPIHWVVSQPKLRYVFGHTSNPRHDDYWGDWDLYQRYSY